MADQHLHHEPEFAKGDPGMVFPQCLHHEPECAMGDPAMGDPGVVLPLQFLPELHVHGLNSVIIAHVGVIRRINLFSWSFCICSM